MTTNFPALVDTHPVIAGTTDTLNTTGKKHDDQHNFAMERIEALQRVSVGPTYVNVKGYGAKGDGTTNDSAAIAAAYAAASDGAIMRWPVGLYMIDPGILSILNSRRLEGDGQEASWIKLRSDTSGAAIDINITGGGPSRRTQYGPQVKGIGIDLSLAPSATGIKFRGNTAWAHLDDVLVTGGAYALDSAAPNCKVTNFHFLNQSAAFIRAVEAGLELHLYDGKLEVSPGVTVAKAMDISVATGGVKGAIYMRGIALNNLGTVPLGIVVACPNGSTASIPIRAFDVTLDNLTGPGWDLRNVTDVQIMGGWVNSAAGTTNGAIRFYGGGGHVLMGIEQLNGGSAGGCSFDFAGGSSAGIALIGNAPATGEYYRLPASGGPSDLFIKDRIFTGAGLSNITNRPNDLRIACATRDWTPQVLAMPQYLRESDPTTAPAGIAVIGSGGTPGLVTVAHTGVAAGWRIVATLEDPLASPGGTNFTVCCKVSDIVPGTSFRITAFDTANVGRYLWRMYGPA